MTLLVERPIDETIFAAGRVSFDMGRCAQIISDERSQMVCIISGIHDDVLSVCQPFDQPARLRAVTPLAGCDDGSDRQAQGIDCRMYLGRQAAFGPANTGSFKPPF